jgi:hypothetical protein
MWAQHLKNWKENNKHAYKNDNKFHNLWKIKLLKAENAQGTETRRYEKILQINKVTI